MELNELLSIKLPLPSILSFLPVAASEQASHVDFLFNFVMVTGFLLLLIVIVPLGYFVWRYRRKTEGQKALTQKDHNFWAEFAWTTLPLVYLMFVFYMGFVGLLDLFTPPIDAKDLRVVGKKWDWQIDYPADEINVGGQGAIIGVALGEPVKLIMSSQDVIHSFFIPNFRVKQDVVPGRYTTLWFTPTKLGMFPVFCTEYCGTGHSNMLAQIKVMEPADFKEWAKNIKAADDSLTPVELGKKLFTSKGCMACHTVDGNPGIGPTFKGLFGKTEETTEGKKIVVDDNRIRNKLLNPTVDVTKGFAPVMPTFQGQLSEKEINGIVEFLKSLK